MMFIGILLIFILGGSIGYFVAVSDVQQKTIELINEKYDCKERNNFNISVGGITIAGANESYNNNS